MTKTLVVIVGPTAVGKTSLAIALARHFSTEVISADSRQFFKEMNIGTAKPDPVELNAVKHHFIGTHSIQEDYNVGQFEKEALEMLEELFNDKDVVIMAGGSGLYIKAVCEGLDELPGSAAVRSSLNKLYVEEGLTGLNNLLKDKDPQYHSVVDQFNPQRLIRALEVCLSSGKAYSSLRMNSVKQRDFKILKIGLACERKELYERINNRVEEMMKRGLLEEVLSLKKYAHLNALRTVGYSELFEYLEGKTELEEAVEKIKTNTRRYAKRQLTWFRKDKSINWFQPDDFKGILNFINEKNTSAL